MRGRYTILCIKENCNACQSHFGNLDIWQLALDGDLTHRLTQKTLAIVVWVGYASGDMGVGARDCDGTHERMARGGHGLPRVSPRLAMLNPSMPCGWATPETALWPYGLRALGPYGLMALWPYGLMACGRAAFGQLLTFWPSHAVRLWWRAKSCSVYQCITIP
jgi:hypothetical protein